jgi:hypothetical protein
MMENRMMDEQIEQIVTQVLERRTEPSVPEDFAARVRAALPPVQPKQRRWRMGKMMCVLSAVVALVGMFALAPHASLDVANLAFDLECVLLVQLFGIVYYLSTRQGIRD